jgi:hypothetical protein
MTPSTPVSCNDSLAGALRDIGPAITSSEIRGGQRGTNECAHDALRDWRAIECERRVWVDVVDTDEHADRAAESRAGGDAGDGPAERHSAQETPRKCRRDDGAEAGTDGARRSDELQGGERAGDRAGDGLDREDAARRAANGTSDCQSESDGENAPQSVHDAMCVR